jgi:CcmD family protein
MNSSGGAADVGDINLWILAVNLIIWTGIFLYLLHLNRKLRDLEKDQ